ncbi:MAG TPA: hypothetical protein VFX16_33730 [Pseudonocardiaceae bacterium]|nr:hypothetical protein [Pseudonocardiaceae bacterium]
MTQSRITDYFPRIAESSGTFTLHVTVSGQEYQIGELDLYEDEDDRNWVNNIEIDAQWQRRTLGRQLIQAAVNRYGTIYFSRQASYEAVEDDDTRHLSTEGAALAASCIRQGLNVQLVHPNDFQEQSDDDMGD